MSNRLICGDVLKVLPTLGRFDCLIADPFDNIGLKYNEHDDNMHPAEYKVFLERLIILATQHADISWISFNAKWIFNVGDIIDNLFWDSCQDDTVDYRLFAQTFTFGQNNKHDCGNGFRPLLRIMHKDAKLYPDAIKVPSWRQKNGDKRAAPGGRVPLDVWDFPRVTGNSRQRRAWHPTQLNEKLIERIIDFSTKPGDTVCDCFSGTVLRVAKDREVTSIELDPDYCGRIAAEHGLTVERLL